MSKTQTIKPEVVGRQFARSYFMVHSRKANDPEASWGGISRYNTQAEAQKAIESLGGRYQHLGGGLTIDFGESIDLYEYRIVRYDCQCEVVATEYRKI